MAAAVGGTLQIFVWPGLLCLAIQYFRVDTSQPHGHQWRPTSYPRGHVAYLVAGVLLMVVGGLVASCGIAGVFWTQM